MDFVTSWVMPDDLVSVMGVAYLDGLYYIADMWRPTLYCYNAQNQMRMVFVNKGLTLKNDVVASKSAHAIYVLHQVFAYLINFPIMMMFIQYLFEKQFRRYLIALEVLLRCCLTSMKITLGNVNHAIYPFDCQAIKKIQLILFSRAYNLYYHWQLIIM